jgi:hypothetical protein
MVYAEEHSQAGMFACEVRLMGTQMLDSAGMLIAADGSSKQRGHERPVANFANVTEALFPSGSATVEACSIKLVFLTRAFSCIARIPT